MTNLIATFQDRFSDWLTALSQHLQLSLLTLLLAIFIAQNKKSDSPQTNTINIIKINHFQTGILYHLFLQNKKTSYISN